MTIEPVFTHSEAASPRRRRRQARAWTTRPSNMIGVTNNIGWWTPQVARVAGLEAFGHDSYLRLSAGPVQNDIAERLSFDHIVSQSSPRLIRIKHGRSQMLPRVRVL